MRRYITVGVEVETEVDVQIKDIIENIDEADWPDIIREKYPEILRTNVRTDFDSDELWRHLCDIAGCGYYAKNKDELLVLIKELLP